MVSVQNTPIVIVGGGFAGVTLAERLERLAPVDVEIVVASADNHLVFTPMLPEVVARTMSPLQVVVAGRRVTKRTRWVEARLTRVDREVDVAHHRLRNGVEATLRYAHLVLACGATVNLDKIPGLADRAFAWRKAACRPIPTCA